MDTHYHLVELAEEIVETSNQAKENLLKTQGELERQLSETSKLSKLAESLTSAADAVAAASSELVEMEGKLLKGGYGKVLDGIEADAEERRIALRQALASLDADAEARKQEMQRLHDSFADQSTSISILSIRIDTLEKKIDNLVELAGSIEAWSDKIERIDKNAQKGFGKIKG